MYGTRAWPKVRIVDVQERRLWLWAMEVWRRRVNPRP